MEDTSELPVVDGPGEVTVATAATGATAARRPSGSEPILIIDDVRLSFGGLHVLQGVNFEVARGEIVGLIGPNGAGKTTLFDVVSGFRPQARGKVTFKGENLLDRKPFERAWL